MGFGLGAGFSDAMKDVEKDMQKAVPTDFNVDMSGAVEGVSGFGGVSGRSFDVTIPLMLDGTTLSRIIAEIQWTQQAAYVRNLGTT